VGDFGYERNIIAVKSGDDPAGGFVPVASLIGAALWFYLMRRSSTSTPTLKNEFTASQGRFIAGFRTR
jgi:hypothetical protein